MTQLLLTLLAATGLSHLLVEGKFILFRLLRALLPSVAKCYQCSGFWTGLVCGLASYGLSLSALGCAFSGSLTSTAAATLLNWFSHP